MTDTTPKTFLNEIKESSASPIEKSLMAFAEDTFKHFERLRYIEEKFWQQQILMYQSKQWLDWDTQARRWLEQRSDKKKPRPMPVSNYLRKIVNANANALGAQLPSIEAIELDDTPDAERAADMAIRAKDIIDVESGMNLLNGRLAKHLPLIGIAAIKDEWDVTTSNGVKRGQMEQKSAHLHVGCEDCGTDTDLGTPEDHSEENPAPGMPCPNCGSTNTQVYPEMVVDSVEVTIYGKGRIKSSIVSAFEFYIPRDCDDPNLARRVLERSRKTTGSLRRKYPEVADQIKSDASMDISQYRLETTRSMNGYTLGSEGRNYKDSALYCEMWFEFEEAPKKLQEMLEEEFEGNPELYGPDALERAMAAGMFVKYLPTSGLILEWGINPWVDEQTGAHYFPYTFYMWEKDPSSPYPNALALDLVPLQKMLNQIDSITILANMANGAGKWLVPHTQAGTFKPEGSPVDIAWFDNIGEGKSAPTWIQPTPLHQQIYIHRTNIINDMMSIGLTEAVSTGQAPGGVGSFRGLAYLGAKAGEQLSTQRQLWEDSHELRYKKVLLIARLRWDDERKSRVAGVNGKYKAVSLTGADLNGNYEIQLKSGTSKPKSWSEKVGMLQMMIEGKVLDGTDPAVRQELLSFTGLEKFDQADQIHVDKALRDLDRAKRGEDITPFLQNPAIKWDVEARFFTEYTLTEDFENDEPPIQAHIMQVCDFLQQKLQAIADAAAQQQIAQAMLGSMGGSQPAPPKETGLAEAAGNAQSHKPSPLGGVPGQGTTPEAVEQAATAQGNAVADSVQ
jgi:hypothetical protein